MVNDLVYDESVEDVVVPPSETSSCDIEISSGNLVVSYRGYQIYRFEDGNVIPASDKENEPQIKYLLGLTSLYVYF